MTNRLYLELPQTKTVRYPIYKGPPVVRDKSFLCLSGWYNWYDPITYPVEIDRSLYSANRYCFSNLSSPSHYNSFLNWGVINRTQGTYDWSVMDQWVDWFYSRGIDLWYSVGGPCPGWTNPSATVTVAFSYGAITSTLSRQFPTDLSNYVAWLNAVGTRYNNKIKYWMTANEPYFGRASAEFGGTASELAVITRLAYQVLKNINPNNQIYGPEPSNIGSNLTFVLTPYLTASAQGYDAGFGDGSGSTGKDWLDIIAVHPYDGDYNNASGPLTNTLPDKTGQSNWMKLKSLLSSLGISKPIWIGEIMYIGNTNLSDELGFYVRHAIIGAVFGVEKMCWFGGGGGSKNDYKNTPGGVQVRNGISQVMKILSEGITQVDVMTDNGVRVITEWNTYYV